MSTSFRSILRNASTRILVIIFGCVLAITVFFLVYGYFLQLNIYQDKELTKLQSIATTLALQIDGDAHQIMFSNNLGRDAIKTNNQDAIYSDIHKKLKKAHEANKLETTIYTMVYDPGENTISFGVSTSEEPFFKHDYEDYPQALIDNYQTGGTIPPYEDENGTWLSAFAPIKDMKGNVVAVIQIDEIFDEFINKVNKAVMFSTLVSLFIIALIAVFLIRSIRSILRKEEAMTKRIVEQKEIIEEKNKDITDSIMYAKKIQDAVLPSTDIIYEAFPDSFVLFKPRDIVSGDFYWFSHKEDKVIIAAVDCTGHGVPGAFMSMIGNILLNQIVNQNNITEPAEILNQLDAGIEKALKQTNVAAESKDGMDLALCTLDKIHKDIEYAGAFRPLLHIREGELMEIKGDRFPIGGGSSYEKTKFTNHKVEIKPGDIFYMFSDGYPDQFGGDKGKKFMNKHFKTLLIENQHQTMKTLGELLDKSLLTWQGEYEQVDDILVIGIRVPEETAIPA